jgi:hypothetical protein
MVDRIWHHQNLINFWLLWTQIHRAGTIFALRASWPSGTLHLTYFVDYNDFFAGSTAAEEMIRVENCCHRPGFPWLSVLHHPDVGTI